jgi:hypothetical protein
LKEDAMLSSLFNSGLFLALFFGSVCVIALAPIWGGI